MIRIAAFVVLVTSISALHADNWPAWRGPTGQGHSMEKDLPLTWDAKTNVRWKIPLEDQGNSTPVIWGDKIFLTQANKGGSVRSLFCFDRKDGKQLWRKDVKYEAKERNWNQSWYANASPAVDGKRVVVSFASAGMYCYDYAGNELWNRTDLGKWEHAFGSGSSPVLYDNLAILWCGPNEGKGRNFLLAVDKETGSNVWQHDEKHGSWATPVLAKIKGQDQMLLAMSVDVKGKPDEQTGYFKGFDPKTGNELWSCRGNDSYVYTSALYANDVAVEMSGYGGSAIAVKVGGTGDITKDRLWKHPRNIQRVGSGIIVGEHVYMVDENGNQHCYELATGNDLWKDQKRLNGTTWGSFVHADGRLYLLMRDGDTVVLKANPKYEQLAINRLGGGEQTNSSIAISDGEIFIRTFKHLWCIKK
jgi:outer membrane protein assembly factor BamB